MTTMNKTKGWWKAAVVYQIYPRSFQDSNGDGVGDIPGIIERLDYLAALGVDVLWLSPVYESPNVDNGYDISNYQGINREFGSMDDFDRLLAEAHQRNLKVVMDLVVNHTSDQHPWFLESRAGPSNEKHDWYIWRDGHEGGAPNQLESVFRGSAWEYAPERDQYYLHLFAKEQPDLNWENELVREAVFSMMRWWLDKGVDGFRMDVISMISKPPAALANKGGPDVPVVHGPQVHAWLRDMREQVLDRYDIMTVGETAGVTIAEAKKYAGFNSGELNMVFQFELMDTGVGTHFGKWSGDPLKLSEIKRIFSKWQTELEGAAWNSLFWANHDQPRSVSRFGNDATPLYREKSAKMLALCLHGMQGTPYIYQGDELGMTNFPFTSLEDCRDVEIFNTYRQFVTEEQAMTHDEMMDAIRRRGRDNARTPMQWNAQKNGGFSSGMPWLAVNPNYRAINADAQMKDPNSIFRFYQKLIGLRKTPGICEYLIDGTYRLFLPDDESIFAYERRLQDTRLLVICNFTANTVPLKGVPAAGRLVLANYDDAGSAELRPYEARMLLEHESKIETSTTLP